MCKSTQENCQNCLAITKLKLKGGQRVQKRQSIGQSLNFHAKTYPWHDDDGEDDFRHPNCARMTGQHLRPRSLPD